VSHRNNRIGFLIDAERRGALTSIRNLKAATTSLSLSSQHHFFGSLLTCQKCSSLRAVTPNDKVGHSISPWRPIDTLSPNPSRPKSSGVSITVRPKTVLEFSKKG
jgi:hypothetical protein